MIVVGVDAAIRRSGWAIVEDDVVVSVGVIAGSAKLDRATRCGNLYREISDVLNHLNRLKAIDLGEGRPFPQVCVAIEKPGAWARSKERSTQIAVEALAMARASVMIAAERFKVPAVELIVDETRALVLGSQRPPTRGSDVKAWVRRMLGLATGVDYDDPDVADAVVVALAGYRLWRMGDSRFPVFQTA